MSEKYDIKAYCPNCGFEAILRSQGGWMCQCQFEAWKKSRPTDIEAKVCRDIAARQAFGVSKYGVTVAGNPLPLIEWLQHAYEECLDQAVYLKRAMEELEPGNPD